MKITPHYKCHFPRAYWLVSLALGALVLPNSALTVNAFAQELARKEAEAIEKMVRRYEDAVNSGDADAAANLYTEHAVRMPPREPAIVGKEAIRRWYREVFKQVTLSEKIKVEELVFSGSLAVCRNSARNTITDKSTGEATLKQSKGIWIFERQTDDGWKLRYACYNSIDDS